MFWPTMLLLCLDAADVQLTRDDAEEIVPPSGKLRSNPISLTEIQSCLDAQAL